MNSRKPGHSAQFFGKSRDFWWNPDFLELMARRWGVGRVRTVLDVGSGVGHWGRALRPLLPNNATITGIDPEPRWVAKARATAKRRKLRGLSYQVASAERLPFDAGRFDMVTCQTVLMHLRDPQVALREMVRVLRPGGLLAVAEPNAITNSLIVDALSVDAPVEEALAMVRYMLTCRRGKKAVGEGDLCVGDVLPGHFREAGLRQISVYQSDRAGMLLPPYASPAQKAAIAVNSDWADQGFFIMPREQAKRHFVAGGGKAADFAGHYARGVANLKKFKKGVEAGALSTSGGMIFYLIAGRKPRRAA
jgi:SAM-dependent methyltransferase